MGHPELPTSQPSEPHKGYFEDEKAAELLMSKGLLFELNRQVLHPFGYALGVRYNDDDAEKDPGKFLGFFIMKTPDPSGMIFEDKNFDEAYVKFLKFLDEEGLKTLDARRLELGYRVQQRDLTTKKE